MITVEIFHNCQMSTDAFTRRLFRKLPRMVSEAMKCPQSEEVFVKRNETMVKQPEGAKMNYDYLIFFEMDDQSFEKIRTADEFLDGIAESIQNLLKEQDFYSEMPRGYICARGASRYIVTMQQPVVSKEVA
jgi:hypothetical protein